MRILIVHSTRAGDKEFKRVLGVDVGKKCIDVFGCNVLQLSR